MKIKGSISILVDRDCVRIEVKDDNASVSVLRTELTAEQFCSCLSRLADVKCEMDVFNLDKVGKKHENKNYTFEIPKHLASSSYTEELIMLAISSLKNDGMSDWEPDKYFSSQRTFHEKDGKNYANCIIRRWI